jgi:CRISPR-associated protein Csm4
VEKFIHSDTLFSAICHAWGQMYGKEELDNLIQSFKQATEEGTEPPFLLSSAFPFIWEEKEGRTIFFLPKPKILPPPKFLEESPQAKKIQKFVKEELKIDDVEWISSSLFREWVVFYKGGERADIEALYRMEKCIQEALNQHLKIEVRPRVQVDRTKGGTRLYFFGSTHFREKCGLYFLIRWAPAVDSSIRERLKSALRFLSEAGIGGERSHGYGMFYPLWNSVELLGIKIEGEMCGFLTLSLWHPSPLDWKNRFQRTLHQYKLIQRPGWVSSPWMKKAYRRKIVTMFEEGSTTEKPVRGGLVDITPSELTVEKAVHKIYRYGFAFTIPVWLNIRKPVALR